MRLFLALPIEGEAAAAAVRCMDALRRTGSGNFTRPENLHLTLAFLGEVSDPTAAQRAMQRVSQRAFTLQFDSLGSFGDILWAGLSPSEPLSALHAQLTTALIKEGFSVHAQNWKPHITLCRSFSGEQKNAAKELGSLVFPANRIVLYRSHSPNGILTYTPICKKILI